MPTGVHDILAPLSHHWDRIIRQPMTQKSVDELEQQVGLAMPAPLRDYLLAVGLFQDLTYWNVSAIEVYERQSQFVDTRKFLCEIVPPKKQNLFPFGDDGAGNVFCLPTTPDEPCRIHFVDRETRKISKRKDFENWLQTIVAKVLRGIRRRVPNEFKVWAVQFSFNDISYEELAALLQSAGQFKEIETEWTNFDTTPAGVTSSDRLVELNGERLQIRRLENSGWDGPIFSFDKRESIAEGLEHTCISNFNAIFKKRCAGYRLVDYGPLDARELENGTPSTS